MIYGCRRRPRRGAVAVFANIRSKNMRRVLARRIGAVVAGHTAVDDVDVIKVGGKPGDRRVAIVTIVAARDMRWMFTGRYCVVVT